MNPKQFTRSSATWLAGGIALAAASYATYFAATWFWYGKAKPTAGDDADELLDRFMPHYEVGSRHKIHVAAPPEVALSAAAEMELESCALVRGIFKAREWILRSKPEQAVRPQGLLAQTRSFGWGVLVERPRARDCHGLRDKALGAVSGNTASTG